MTRCGIRCTCGAGHQTFGACLRAKNLSVGYSRSAAGFDYTAEKAKNAELDLYARARKQGIQPASTKAASVREALDKSDQAGRAYDAATGGFR